MDLNLKNVTCGVSQLPIKEEDEFALFILTKSDESQVENMNDWMFHADALFIPITPAIFGEIRWNGNLSGLKMITPYNLFVEHLEFDIKVKGRTGLGLSSKNTKVENSLKELKEDGLEGVIEKIVNGKIDNITYMFIHKGIYDEMVNISTNKEPFYDNNLGNKREDYKENIINWLKETKTREETGESKNKVHLLLNKSVLIDLLRDNYDLFLNKEDLVEDFVDLMLVNYTMEISRKMWMPQTGLNSQNREYRLARFIGNYATEQYIKELESR